MPDTLYFQILEAGHSDYIGRVRKEYSLCEDADSKRKFVKEFIRGFGLLKEVHPGVRMFSNRSPKIAAFILEAFDELGVGDNEFNGLRKKLTAPSWIEECVVQLAQRDISTRPDRKTHYSLDGPLV